MNDLEQPMLSYYVIYFEKLGKIIQQKEKEALSYKLRISEFTAAMPVLYSTL